MTTEDEDDDNDDDVDGYGFLSRFSRTGMAFNHFGLKTSTIQCKTLPQSLKEINAS